MDVVDPDPFEKHAREPMLDTAVRIDPLRKGGETRKASEMQRFAQRRLAAKIVDEREALRQLLLDHLAGRDLCAYEAEWEESDPVLRDTNLYQLRPVADLMADQALAGEDKIEVAEYVRMDVLKQIAQEFVDRIANMEEIFEAFERAAENDGTSGGEIEEHLVYRMDDFLWAENERYEKDIDQAQVDFSPELETE